MPQFEPRPVLRAIVAACCLGHAVFAASAIPEELQARIKAKEKLTDAELGKFLPYIHPLVREPVGGGLVLSVPPEPGNQTLARVGFVDVSAAPFSADPMGKRNSTRAIQDAVNFARDHQMAAFFRQGSMRSPTRLSASKTWECGPAAASDRRMPTRVCSSAPRKIRIGGP